MYGTYYIFWNYRFITLGIKEEEITSKFMGSLPIHDTLIGGKNNFYSFVGIQDEKTHRV